MRKESKLALENLGMEPVLNSDTVNGAVFKVKFALKASAFCASVMTLSWFFEGWRKIHENVGFWSVSILLAGILCTTALITLQAFWIYVEEKQKGALLRRIGLFDRLYEGILRRNAPGANKGEKAEHA